MAGRKQNSSDGEPRKRRSARPGRASAGRRSTRHATDAPSEKKPSSKPALAGRRLRWSRLILCAFLLVFFLALVALFGARPLLTLSAPPSPADAILVLGGETPRRSAKAADLFKAGLAPRIFVSGGGDAPIIRRYLIREGVPADRIFIENRSGTTWENAVFVTPELRNHGVRRVLLVTSWFHTRRAVATFRRVAGDIRYSPVPAEYSWAAYRWPWLEQTKYVCREYAKTAGYMVRHRVSPFVGAVD